MFSPRRRRRLQSEQDENMIEIAGDDVDVPEELLKMVDEDATEEEGKDSIMGQFQNLQNMDMDQLKEKASATVTELKTKAEEKCSVMWTARDGWLRLNDEDEDEKRRTRENLSQRFLGILRLSYVNKSGIQFNRLQSIQFYYKH